MKSLLWFLTLAVMSTMAVPAFADDGPVILNPGTVSGSVSIAGRQITSITVYAIDTVKAYSGSVTVNVPAATNSINYVLTLEGDRDYYVMAEARVSAAGSVHALFPVAGPVTVPVGGDVPLNLSMTPGIISGTISTGSSTNTIQSYTIYGYVTVPEFGSDYRSDNYAGSLNAPGDTGRDYTLLMPPGAKCDVYATIHIDGVGYSFYDYGVTAPTAGVTKDRDYTIDVTAASISGTARLLGINVTSASMWGSASSPYRYRSSSIPDVSTGLYTLEVDAGAWTLQPEFYFNLPGDLSGLTGGLSVSYSTAMNVKAGDHLTGVDFIVNPGFIPGTLSLWGANTNFKSAQVEAYASSYGGYTESYVDPDTGGFLMVCSPGDWRPGYYQYLYFDYPDDPDPALYSYVYQSNYGSADVRTVLAGQTTQSVNLTFGTITVRRYFYVAGGGTLSRPYIRAIRHESPYSQAYGYGSYSPTTEGQAIVTLLLPGTYTIEAFATVNSSNTEFGSVDVTVDEGDVVVIGGSDRPTVQLTNPTNNDTVCGKKVTVEGTITDDHGIASITINGEDATFDLVESGAEGKTYHFSHEVILDLGANEITIVVQDTDNTEPVVLKVNVVSEDCPKPCVVTLTSPTNGQTVNSSTIVVEGTATDDVGVASVKINGQDVAFDIVGDPADGTKNVHFSRQIGLDCGENTITIVVSDLDGTEPTTVTTTVTSTDCTIPCLIDIYPNRVPNRVYLKINYTIYVAVLGTEGFAVTDVDSSTVRFGRMGTEASPVLMPMILDLNGDGFKDALYGFRTFDCGFKVGDSLGWLTAETTAGKAVKGSDSVSITP